MPVMDGYEFVKRLRLDPAFARIPVLFYTAPYGEREARAYARSNGLPFVLTKPGAPEEVLTIVSRVLAGEDRTRRTSLPRRRIRIALTCGCSPTSSRKRPTISRTPTRACGR